MIAAVAAACVNPLTLGTRKGKVTPGATVTPSENSNSSMFSSVSVPLLPGPTIPAVVPLSMTVTRFPKAVPVLVIVYWERGPENTAVSQLSGLAPAKNVAAPQSAGPTTGVTMLRTMWMFPGLSR